MDKKSDEEINKGLLPILVVFVVFLMVLSWFKT